MMPGLNGLGVLDALRRLGIETNVVMVSAVNDSETALEALRLGACDYLTKPFGLSELERVVRRLTEHGVAGAPTAGRSRALPHALIVGGDPGFRASLAVALRTRGRVDAVESALAARGVLARTLPDVIVAGDDVPAPRRQHRRVAPRAVSACRNIEGCHGLAGAPRAWGGMGGHFGAPMSRRALDAQDGGGLRLELDRRVIDAEARVQDRVQR